MILITCIDSNKGMLFNNRRQSRDKILIEKILHKISNKRLWINSFSSNLFYENLNNVIIDDNFIEKAEKDDYCFIENISPSNIEAKIDKIILYDWNRNYPADLFFDIELENWNLESELDFEGYSHEKITEKIYIRRGQ